MARFIAVLLALFWASAAYAQTCPAGSTCSPLETYIYGSTAATAPYASSLRIPLAPSSSASSLQYIPGNVLTTLTDTQTLTNKTLTTPTINGAALSGTFSGNATFSGTDNFTGTFEIGGFSLSLGGNTTLPAAPGSTQCLHMSAAGAITTTGSDCGAGGGGSISVSGGGNTTTGVTTVAFGNGFVATPNGANTTSTVNESVTDNTKTTSYQVAAVDMANALNLAAITGTPVLTLPAESSTIFAPGMTVGINTVKSTVTWSVTNSTGLTYNGPSTFPPGTTGTLVANADGTHLDWFGIAPDGSTITLSSGLLVASGGGSGCTVSGGAGAVYNNGSSACTTKTDQTFSSGTLTLGINTSELGAVQMYGGTSGNTTIEPSAVAGSSTVATLPANTGTLAELNLAQSWTAPQLTATETPSISTSTFTPLFNTTSGAKQNIRIVLVHASCPCTLANPASLGAGQSGMFEIVQSATGSDTIGTWGSEYEYAGGTASITLSTGTNAVDYIPYYVDSTASFIVLGGIIKGPAH